MGRFQENDIRHPNPLVSDHFHFHIHVITPASAFIVEVSKANRQKLNQTQDTMFFEYEKSLHIPTVTHPEVIVTVLFLDISLRIDSNSE